jgi:hypothetical protein
MCIESIRAAVVIASSSVEGSFVVEGVDKVDGKVGRDSKLLHDEGHDFLFSIEVDGSRWCLGLEKVIDGSVSGAKRANVSI